MLRCYSAASLSELSWSDKLVTWFTELVVAQQGSLQAALIRCALPKEMPASKSPIVLKSHNSCKVMFITYRLYKAEFMQVSASVNSQRPDIAM